MPKDAVVVPDTHLLFHGDFKRSGVDLILSGDDREIVLHDYFKGEKRAALSSPDGAHLTGDIVSALTGSVQVSQADGSASVAKVIGHVTKLLGTATAIRNGVSIILHQGDNVEKGDVVQSGSNSTLGVTFIDGTVFGLSSNARMVLNEMVYDPNGSNNSSLISLVAGTISFVAGQTAKHGDMKIDTPVATMGIRGTAVLVEIDFTVPGQGGQPDAKFQVLVEPDGTTGSYILFDKTTLQPLAVVNQAGQQINISQGVITQTNVPLSPDVQKLINDVFTLKYTDNVNPKTDTGHNNTITPQTGPVLKADNGTTATPIYKTASLDPGSNPTGNPGGPIDGPVRVPGPPEARVLDLAGNLATGFSIAERAGITGDANHLDSITGQVTFTDPNRGDTPSVQVNFSAFAYQNAQHQDVTATLSLLQLADIAKTEVNISIVPAPGNNNNGSATFTYSVPDKAFDFLAAGETLTLTYVVRVDNNFAPLNETRLIQFTITVTGTNDKPVIATGPQTIAFHGGTSEPGGSLPLTSNDPTSGTLTFADVDLTDTHTVSVKLTSPAGSIPPAPLAFFEQALSAKIATDSTGTGTGTVSWKLADIPVYDADFIPAGETLTLTYTVTVTDKHGATSTQTVTVTITGTDAPAVVWIATTTGENSGGLWRDGTNWETGLAPTANDDVIIITDQLHGLTPSFPVTVDTQAFAKSLTMNDFGASPPILIVQSQKSLTIGGALKLGADSVIQNYGTISVGGKVEVLDQSTLQNSGTVNLAKGGDFGGQSHISNATGGTIEVTGGTLNVSVNVANSGLIEVDTGAALVLDTATITGGTVTINGTLELDGTSFLKNGTLSNFGAVNARGADTFDNEIIANHHSIEIFAGAALTLDQASKITNTGYGAVTVDGAGKLALNGAGIDGGVVTNKAGGEIDLAGNAVVMNGALGNAGTIKVSGSGNALHAETVTANAMLDVLAGGALTIDQVSTVANGAIQIDGAGKLTLSAATVTGGTVTNNGEIDLAGNGIVKNGTFNNAGTIHVNGAGNALDNETVTANSMLEVTAHGALLLDLGTRISNGGAIVVDGAATLTLNDAAIDGGAVTNTVAGAIDLTGNAVIKNGTLNNAGTIHISGTGNKLDGETVAANAMLEVLTGGALLLDLGTNVTNSGTITIDGGATLTLNAATISGGVINNYSVSAGAIDVTGDSAIDGHATLNNGAVTIENGVTLTLGNVTVNGTAFNDIASGATIAVAGGDTLTLQNGATVTGGSLVISGTLHLETASGAHLDNVIVSGGGAIVVDDPSIDATLFLADGTSITGGTLTIGAAGALDVETAAGASLHHVAVSDGNVIDVGVTTTAVLTLDGGTTIAGGKLKFGDGADQLVVEKGANGLGATLDGVAVSGGGAIDIGVNSTGAVLTLDGGTSITGGTLSVGGGDTLKIANGAGVTDATLDGVHVIGSGAVQVDHYATLAINGGTISGGTLTIAGELDATGSIVIASSVVNTGTIEVKSGTLDLEGGLSGSGQIIIDADAKLQVDGAYTQAVTFNGGDAELQIDTPTFGGQIQGLAATDQIDLRTIEYDLATTTATYASNQWYTGGVLTVTDAHGHSISLTLVGAGYDSAHFVGSMDSSGHTLITLSASDDAPVFDSASQTANFSEAADVTGSPTTDPQPPAMAAGSIAFTDIDLTDRPTATIAEQSVVWTDGDRTFTLSSGQITALQQGLSLAPVTNTNSGTIGWSYAITDGALDFLGQGQTVTIDSTITLDDQKGGSDTAHVVITITGTNDKPVVAALSDSVDEGAQALTKDLLAGATDADDGETATLDIANVRYSVDGGSASLMAPAGIYLDGHTLHVDPSNAVFNHLAVGQHSTIVVSYDVIDAQGATVAQTETITVNGTNDAPVVAAALSDARNEGTAAFTTDLLAGASDADDGETETLDIANVRYQLDTGPVSATPPAGVSLDGYILHVDPSNAAFDHLAVGQHNTIVVSYDVIDAQGATVAQTETITINGTNDAPVVAGVLSDVRNEGTAAFTANLLAGASDADDGETESLDIVNVSYAVDGGTTSATPPAGVSLDGHILHVDPSNAVFNHLAVGQHSTIVVSYDVIDAQGATVAQTETITINGTNDAPVVAGVLSDVRNEGTAAFTTNLLAGASDADDGETASLDIVNVSYQLDTGPVSATAPAGVSLDGHTLYVDPSNAVFNPLAVGQHSTIVVSYDVIDAQGATVAQTETITINGTNDAPMVGAALSDARNEGDAAFTTDLLAGATDADDGETATLDIANVRYKVDGGTESATPPTGVSLAGHTLSVDPTDPSFDHLAVGQSTSIVVTYDVTDVHGATVTQTETITINGTYDPPIGSRVAHLPPVIDTTHFTLTQASDGSVTITGLQVTDADPQANIETFTLSADALHGSVQLASSGPGDLAHANSALGSISYHPDNTQPQSDNITLTVTDNFGGSDTVHFIFNESGPTGNSGKVTLTGAGGKDVIIATAYNDTLEGGAGADQFVFAPSSNNNQDTINNFTPGEDHLDIRAFLTVGTDITQWLSTHLTSQGKGQGQSTLLTLDDHDSVVLKGVQISSLHSSDFIVHG